MWHWRLMVLKNQLCIMGINEMLCLYGTFEQINVALVNKSLKKSYRPQTFEWYVPVATNASEARMLQMSFICHIHHYTKYNQQWNVFSAFNPSKSTHTWSSGQLTLQRPGSSWGFGALLKGLTSVVDNSCRSRDLNPQPRIKSPTLYPLGHDCPIASTFNR